MLAVMRRVDVIVPRRLAASAVRAVHRAGVLHLVPFEPPADVGTATFDGVVADAAGARFGAALDRITELAILLGQRGPDGTAPGVHELWDLPDAEVLGRVAALEPVRAEADRLLAARQRAFAEAARLSGYLRLIDGLRSVLAGLPVLRGYGTTGIVVRAAYRSVIPAIHAELERIADGRCEVVSADIGPDRVGAVLIYPVRAASEVRALLGGRDLEEVALPDELTGVAFEELGPRLRARLGELAVERERASTELTALAARHDRALGALRAVLADRVAEAAALGTAAGSDHLAVISGWIPARDLDAFRAAVERDVGGGAIVVERKGTRAPGRGVPVALENGPLVRAFEPLAAFAVVPRYGSIDPTPLLALTLPAFIGMMVGDIGYGLVLLGLLAVAGVLRPASSIIRRLWPIGLVTGLSTVLFGVLYGEWFGNAGATLFGLQHVWLNREHAVAELLVFALAIGVGQVGLGLVLGVANAARLGHRREAAGRLALLATIAALLVALAALAGLVPTGAGFVALGVAAVAFVLLVLTLGISGPIEVIGVVGNILSYARLMAIGLASVMLGLVANRLGGLLEGAVAGILVAGLIHTLNIALGFFDASIQGVRLHYVEFFSRFVEPGGVRYRPFASALARAVGGAAGQGGT